MKSTSFSSTRDTWNVSPFHQEGKNGQSQSPPNYGLDFVDHPSATIQRVEDMGQQPVADASFQSQQPPNNKRNPQTYSIVHLNHDFLLLWEERIPFCQTEWLQIYLTSLTFHLWQK